MNEEKNRFHVLYSVHTFQRSFLLCLLPLARALFVWRLDALFTALKQDAFLLVFLAAASTLVWRAGWWHRGRGCLVVHSGLFFRRARVLPAAKLSCVSVEQPPLYRPLGAARLRLYFADTRGCVTLYLGRRTAETLAEELIPVPAEQKLYEPHGYDKLGLTAVSANLLATVALAVMAVQAWPERQQLEDAAFRGLTRTKSLLAGYVGTGLAWALAAAALLWTGALLVSASRTAFFQVRYGGGVVRTSSGFFTHIDRIIRQSAITACTIQAGPAARVFRRFPVHVQAGGYTGRDLPLFLYSPAAPEELAQFAPGFALVPSGPADKKDRSLPAHLLLPGILFLLVLVLLSVSTWQLPEATPPLAALLVYCGALLFCGWEGFCTEGVCFAPGGAPVVRYTRNFTHYTAVLRADRVGYYLLSNPFSAAVGRCNVYFTLPGRCAARVRSIKTGAFLQSWPRT